ncbi:MAG: glycosyltransferase [Panacibacter sp.]
MHTINNSSSKPVVLISGVNLTEGGPLSIFKDAVKVFTDGYLSAYKLVLLVNNRDLFPELNDNPDIAFCEYAYPKRSWLLKIWFEYVHCFFISKKIKPFLWFSIHDVTPTINTKNKVVYCHNPAPFYKLSLKEIWNEKSLFFFRFFYSVIYRINIRTNSYIIVQQQWLREEFIKRYKVNNVIVAYPDIYIPAVIGNYARKENDVFRFCYPALPRSFKNFEVIFAAAQLLQKKDIKFEVILTLDGTENQYSNQLVQKYKQLSCVKFIGRQSREKTFHLYAICSCLIFPSKMETWGLPITEMKLHNKPILVADFRYAHETVGNYDKACFFDASDPLALAALMEKAINGSLQYYLPDYKIPPQPFVQSWKELFDLILSDDGKQHGAAQLKVSSSHDA